MGSVDFAVKVLVSYINARGIGGEWGQQDFYDKFWADMKTVYDEFVQHMENTDQDATYGQLCATAAQLENPDAMLQSDRVVCEFMLGALLFKHGLDVSGARRSEKGPEDHGQQVHGYMTCIIVNVFIQHILGDACLKTEGAQYAEQAIHGLLQPNSGLEQHASCDGVNLATTRVAGGHLRNKIGDWIKKEKSTWGDTAAAGILSSRCQNWSEGGQTPRGTAQKD
ncbi:hypothetical protein AK88_05685, partial [Plasmodium fragile]